MTATSAATSVSDEERTALTDTVTRFARTEIAPHVDAWDAAGEFPRSLYRRAADLGLLGLGYPEQYGGTPASYSCACRCGARSAAMEPVVACWPACSRTTSACRPYWRIAATRCVPRSSCPCWRASRLPHWRLPNPVAGPT